jgi:hypothetical protein
LYGLVSDIKEAEKEAENPPLFKKMFDGGSVEEQALNAVIAKKKIEEQEKQVRELITWAYGVETYKEMMQMRKDIKAKRERMIYKQRRRQRRMLDVSASVGTMLGTLGSILPPISALFTIVWVSIRIWETDTVQSFRKKDED